MKSTNPYTIFFDNDWLKASQIDHRFMEDTIHFGQGISQEARAYSTESGTHIFKAREHFEQLLLNARDKGISCTYTSYQLVQITYHLLEKNELSDAFVHALFYSKNGESKLVVTAKAATPFSIQENLRIDTSYYQNDLSVDVDGTLTCKSANPFFFIKDEVVYTPKLERDTTPGVMRNSIIECAIALGHPVIEKTISLEELNASEVAFFSNASHAMSIVEAIDGYTFTADWKSTIAHDLLMMLKSQLTNEDFWNHSII